MSVLVLDIGKSNAKLALIDAHGEVLAAAQTANASVLDEARGYRALGTEALAAWIDRAVPELLRGRTPSRISVTTHGAAFCALGDEGLVLPPIDYEWDAGTEGYGETTAAFEASLANFAHHGTPRLPLGLNAGRQIDFVMRRFPAEAARIRCWLPYPQFWAWWLSGVAVSEVSSLGCHTGLWAPAERRFSDWALARGIAFAPLRSAWDVIGTLRPALRRAWGLSEEAEVEVLAGVHDSNACLARYLRDEPDATIVSTGTWCIVMAPGAEIARLSAGRDELVNVAVDGRPVATARFMGGREFAALCDGADPALATVEALEELLRQRWLAVPAFADSGGPFIGRRGTVLKDGQPATLADVPAALRPALAALYGAEMSALLVGDLTHESAAPVILEGPMAQSPAYRAAIAALLAPRRVLRSCDALEGTARGAWLLAHWQEERVRGRAALDELRQPPAALAEALRAHARAWRNASTMP